MKMFLPKKVNVKIGTKTYVDDIDEIVNRLGNGGWALERHIGNNGIVVSIILYLDDITYAEYVFVT